MKNLIASWIMSDWRTMSVYPIRNEKRLLPYSLWVMKDNLRYEKIAVYTIPALSNRWNSWLVHVYRNKKTGKEYWEIYRDWCFYPYQFTFKIYDTCFTS